MFVYVIYISLKEYSRQNRIVYRLILKVFIMHSLAGEVYFHCSINVNEVKWDVLMYLKMFEIMHFIFSLVLTLVQKRASKGFYIDFI